MVSLGTILSYSWLGASAPASEKTKPYSQRDTDRCRQDYPYVQRQVFFHGFTAWFGQTVGRQSEVGIGNALIDLPVEIHRDPIIYHPLFTIFEFVKMLLSAVSDFLHEREAGRVSDCR